MEEKHFKTSLPTINLVYAGAGERRKGEREGQKKKESQPLTGLLAEMEDGCARRIRRTCFELKSGDQRQTDAEHINCERIASY